MARVFGIGPGKYEGSQLSSILMETLQLDWQQQYMASYKVNDR